MMAPEKGMAVSVCEDVTTVTAGETKCWKEESGRGSLTFLLWPIESL